MVKFVLVSRSSLKLPQIANQTSIGHYANNKITKPIVEMVGTLT